MSRVIKIQLYLVAALLFIVGLGCFDSIRLLPPEVSPLMKIGVLIIGIVFIIGSISLSVFTIRHIVR